MSYLKHYDTKKNFFDLNTDITKSKINFCSINEYMNQKNKLEKTIEKNEKKIKNILKNKRFDEEKLNDTEKSEIKNITDENKNFKLKKFYLKRNRMDFEEKIHTWLQTSNYDVNDVNNKLNNIQNVTIIRSIYNEIKNYIHLKGYEINDENQFKEDFIYYMYILSL